MTIDFGLNGPLSLLRMLGFDPEMLVRHVKRPDSGASSITDAYAPMPMAQLAELLERGAIAMPGDMPPPSARGCPCPHRYAQPDQSSFASSAEPMTLPMLMSGGRGAMFQEMMRVDPFARQHLEMMLGGRIMPGDFGPGSFDVAPFQRGAMPAGSTSMNAAYGPLAMMQQEAAMLGMPGAEANPFYGMMLAALSQAASREMRAARKKKKKKKAKKKAAARHAQRGQRARRGHAPAHARGHGGQGAGGAFRGGSPGPHQGAFGLGRSGGDDIAGMLNDPTLTVEDKVTLMIMMIMKKMDKDIEKQAQNINALQQQQNGGGAGGGAGVSAAGGAPSIDVETMKLKRLIDKRSQMFDMLRQIIDKYNQTAKGIIDTIGR